ncbi:unnamed protein product [Phytomonas sp. Hart1]|nr:unnamed protein product [Phytomonas sp. Hart1]|eukprot:CCW70847.1 unnamed protein product [Phytomonas sp. isolate Hart1]
MSLKLESEFTDGSLGKENIMFKWHPHRPLIAVTGSKVKMFILDRVGKLLHQFSLASVVDFEWDRFSDTLGLITSRTSTLHLYSHETSKVEMVETKCKDLTLIRWSKRLSLAAIGTQKGTVVILNQVTKKRLPVYGTHSQAIIDAVWTELHNRLVLISADNTMSISDSEGNVLSTVALEASPLSLSLVEAIPNSDSMPISVVACNLGSSLHMANLCTGEVFAAKFDESTGFISALTSTGSAFLLGFSTGLVGLAGLGPNQLTMTSSSTMSKNPVSGIAFGKGNGFAAVSCDGSLRFISVAGKDIGEEKKFDIAMPTEASSFAKADWSSDGQSIVIVKGNGNFYIYSINVRDISTSWAKLLFYLTSSRVVGVRDIHGDNILCTMMIDIEPQRMAAGMGSFAVYADNEAHYYDYHVPQTAMLEPPDPSKGLPARRDRLKPDVPDAKFIRTVEYPVKITDLKVNSTFAAVLYDGHVRLHVIRDPNGSMMTLPPDSEHKILTIGLSEALFVCATSVKVYIVALPKMQIVAEYEPRSGLKQGFLNPSCTRMVYIDDNNDLLLLNLVTEVAFTVRGYDKRFKSILWDWADPTVFAAYNHEKFMTFVYSPHSTHGPTCESITERHKKDEPLTSPIPTNCVPISLFSGVVAYQSKTGILSRLELQTHHEINARGPNTTAFYNNFSLNRLRWCSQNISMLKEADELVLRALHFLDVELAIRIYRQLSQPSLVLYLEKIKHIQEKNLLIGHISMIMGSFDDAQKSFLHSSQPLRALEMRRDLMHWEQALGLAKELAPGEIPVISKEYAQQLEYRGEYMKALQMFTNGHRSAPTGHASTELFAAQEEVRKHNTECLKGVARCNLRTGRLNEGMPIALDIDDKAFAYECAKLCEENKRFEAAARLYERAGEIEQAAMLYIEKCNNLKAAGQLLPQIKSRSIIGRYANGKEMEGSFNEAEQAYTQAEDWDNVVRIKVQKLNDLQGAYVIVRRTRSTNAAALVARMCQSRNEFASAVEFLVVAKCTKEAFELSKQHNCLSNYENALLNQVVLKDGVAPVAKQDEFNILATYYDEIRKPGQAAVFYRLAGNSTLALKKYIESGQPEDIEKAIEVVGKAHSDGLTSKLIDFLMGDTDGQPKDPSYIFRLYMALGSYEKASKTCVIIAAREQEMGNYKAAHKTLIEACRILREKSIRVPSDLRRSLMILHSYIIVKDLITVMHDETTASRMLLRVAHNIQKFESHAATIISSTVLQCEKSGFAHSAFQLSCLLIQNEEYRTQLSEKNRRKIESIVRRGGKEAAVDPVESTKPCPFCDQPVPESELDCGACRNTLPFCIVTGKHIVKGDFTTSPCCGFPAIYSALVKRLCEKSICPMCESALDVNKVQAQSKTNLEVF